MYNKLKTLIDQYPLSPFLLNSRVHSLQSFCFPKTQVFLKRDDELSCAISGSKMRKYASLLPFLKSEKIESCVLIGGAYSNHILGFSQLLIEHQIKPILVLREPGQMRAEGNLLFTQILVEKDHIHWVKRSTWEDAPSKAAELVKELSGKGIKATVIPEGALMKYALPGAMTLSLDILRNELDLDGSFDHIFVDAGVGLQASALILSHAWCKSHTKIHVLLLAQKKDEFTHQLLLLKSDFEELFKEECVDPTNYSLYVPGNAASFGSVNKKVIHYIAQFARREGVLLDPIYSAKLLMEASKRIEEDTLQGNILIIHSGGVLTLGAFHRYFTPNMI